MKNKMTFKGIHYGRLLCFILSAGLALYLGFFAYSGHKAIAVVKYGGYWLMLFTFVLLLIALLRVVFSGAVNLKLKALSALYVISVSVILCVLQEGNFKILMDEPVLAATALQVHEEKEVMTVARAYNIEGEVYLLDAYLDKRPYFYPFLVSVLHDITGYRALQGVWLNRLLTPLLLGLLFVLASRLGGHYAGYLAVVLFATAPLLAMNVNGSSYELLNLVMLIATVLAAIRYFKAPDGASLNLLLLLTVLLVQTRYESAVYVLPVGALVLWNWFREKNCTMTWTMVLLPLLLVMVPIQHGVVSTENPELWDLKSDTTAQFSLAYVPANLKHAWAYFFSLETEQPNSLLLSLLFIPALIAVVFNCRRMVQFSENSEQTPVVLFSIFVCGSFCLLMIYNWGQLDDIIATRIALPFILFQAILTAIVYSHCSKKTWWHPVGLLVCVIFFLGVTLPKTLKTDFLNRSPISDQAKWLQSKVRDHQGANPLFVADLHMIALVEKVSTLPSFMAPERKLQIDFHLREETFGDILFFYLAEVSEEGELEAPAVLSENFNLEVLDESLMPTGQPVQLARLRAVKFSAEETRRLDDQMPNPEEAPEAYFEFFARSLP